MSASARCCRSTPPACRALAITARRCSVDWRVALFTLRRLVATGLMFGVVPALHARALGPERHAAGDGSGAAGGGRDTTSVRSRARRRSRSALALMLVIGSGAADSHVDRAPRACRPGFDASNVLTMSMSFTGPRFASAAVGRPADPRRRGAAASAARRRARRARRAVVPLEGGYGLPFKIVGRPLEQRSIPRRRRMDDRVARILRGVQDSGVARPHVHRSDNAARRPS